MALVGDVIVEAREKATDPPPLLNKPVASGFSSNTVSGNLSSGNYYFQITGLNQWGETLPTAEETKNFAAGITNQLIFDPNGNGFLAPGTTSFRVYIVFGTPGGEVGYFSSNGLAALTVNTLAGLIPGTVPVRSSAFQPDSDGSFVSASTIFRWLNDSLRTAGRIAGGIPYINAFQGVSGQGFYRITGKWINLTNMWFDGWPVSMGRRGDQFLHNTMSSISGILSIEEYADTTLIQLWPQPNRTGATTTLTGPMGISDTTMNVVNAGGFLPLGLVQVDNEIMGYFQTAPTGLLNLTRGLNGTTPATHVISSQVVELNVRLSGFRQPTEYVVGQSALNLPLIPGWEVPIIDYILGQYKKTENQDNEAKGYEQSFEAMISKMAKEFRGKTKAIQLGGITREVYPGGYGGGLLIG